MANRLRNIVARREYGMADEGVAARMLDESLEQWETLAAGVENATSQEEQNLYKRLAV
jgi:uncharacterized protein YutE (UPF0331/DUF86 family)